MSTPEEKIGEHLLEVFIFAGAACAFGTWQEHLSAGMFCFFFLMALSFIFDTGKD